MGFFQDLVGGDASKTQAGLHLSSKNRNINQSSASSSSNSTNLASETKEQIEWLHFEYFTLLDSSSSNCGSSSSTTNGTAASGANNDPKLSAKSKLLNSPFSNSNILLVIGYKTGFSIWSIDVIKFSFFLIIYHVS